MHILLILAISCETENEEDISSEYMHDTLPTGKQYESLTLSTGKTYYLKDKLIMTKGTVLTIPEGVKIIPSAMGPWVYVAIEMGAKIQIQGTEENPVKIASERSLAGDWGGLVICGKAVTTAGIDAVSEVEGLLYGGNDNEDSSGSIEYLIISGGGAGIGEVFPNSLSLYAVGSNTHIENIVILNGADDGIEFYGGAAITKNVLIYDQEDDAVDWTEGWSGQMENTYIIHEKEGFSTAFEGDKVNNNPTFTNVTAICSSEYGGTALQFKKESGATFNNLYLKGYSRNIDMKDDGPIENVIIDGKVADPEADYSIGSMINEALWDWRYN